MANRYANLVGSNKIKDEWQKINTGFDLVQQDVDQLQADLAQEIADREAAVEYVDQRVDNIIVGGGPDKDPELVDIRNLDPSYTPQREINVAGDVTRDMQAQFVAHKAEKATQSKIGHVRPDGKTIIADVNGVISSVLRSKYGSFSRDMSLSGDQIITGVGFRPKAIIFIARSNVAGTASWGLLSGAGADNRGMRADFNQTPNAFSFSNSISMRTASGILFEGIINEISDDGFTVSWTAAGGTPTGIVDVRYLALG